MEKIQLQGYIQSRINVKDEELDLILDCFESKFFKKGTLLLQKGQIADEFYYIQKGCIRTYYLTDNGDLKTRHIDFENSLIGGLASFINQKPSFEFVEAIENVEIFVIKRTNFFKLLNQAPRWKDFYITLLEKGYSFQNNKIESHVTLTAKDRYQQLLKEHPDFILRLPNNVLASYLDISPETLSRIKHI
jgi:CRP-like cAMP-binding protein